MTYTHTQIAARQQWYADQIEQAELAYAYQMVGRYEAGDDVPDKAHFISLWLAERPCPVA